MFKTKFFLKKKTNYFCIVPRAEHVWKLVVKLVRMVLGQPSGSGPCIVAVTMIRRRQRRRKMAMLCYEYVMFHKFWRLIPFGYTTLLKTSEWFVVLNPAMQSHPTHGVRERTNNIKSTMTRAPAKVAQVGTWWISMGGLAVLQFSSSRDVTESSERRLVEPRNPESTLELSPMPKLPQTKSFQGRGRGTLAVKLPELNSEFEGFSHDFLTEIMKN